MNETFSFLDITGPLTNTLGPNQFQYAENREFQRRYSEIQKANLNLKMRNVELEKRISSILTDGHIDPKKISQFLDAGRQIDELNTQIHNLQSDYDESKKINNELTKQNEILQSTVENLKNQITNLQASLTIQEQGTNDQSAITKQLTTMKLENSKLKQELASHEATNAEQAVLIFTLQSQLNDINNDGVLSTSEISRIRSQKSEYHKESIRTKQLNQSLQKELNQVNSLIDEQKIIISHQKDTIKGLQHDNQVNLQWINEFSNIMREKLLKLGINITDLYENIEEKTDFLESRFNDFKTSTSNKIIEQIDRAYQKQSEINETHISTIDKLVHLCADVSNLDPDQIPNAQELTTNMTSLEFFSGRVKSAISKTLQQSQIETSRLSSASLRKQNKASTEISPLVIKMHQNLQDTLNNLATIMHSDHKELTDMLNKKK